MVQNYHCPNCGHTVTRPHLCPALTQPQEPTDAPASRPTNGPDINYPERRPLDPDERREWKNEEYRRYYEGR